MPCVAAGAVLERAVLERASLGAVCGNWKGPDWFWRPPSPLGKEMLGNVYRVVCTFSYGSKYSFSRKGKSFKQSLCMVRRGLEVAAGEAGLLGPQTPIFPSL